MDQARLREKLASIEALFAGATSDGERVAAGEARRRIQERLRQVQREDPPVEFRFSMQDAWSRRVLASLLRRYGLEPYRYRGQRRTTVMVKMPAAFMRTTLWPEYQQISSALRTYLDEVTERIITEMIHRDGSEASEVAGAAPLGEGGPGIES